MKNTAYPRTVIFRERILENTRRIVGLCRRFNVSVTGVTKGICAHPRIVSAMLEGGCSRLADSRIENIARLRDCAPAVPLLLLRIPMPSEIPLVVAGADCCVVSMNETIYLIQRECERMRRDFPVMLMFDLGDLREGFWPDETESVAHTLLECPRVRPTAVGTNFGCFGGTVPSAEALRQLLDIRDRLQALVNSPVEIVSGGSTSSLELLERGILPEGITDLRIGEGILLGSDVTRMRRIPYLSGTTMILEAEIVEVRRKPSVPLGEIAYDAFGHIPCFEDRGSRLRAIAAVGKQDVDIEGLDPIDHGVAILGASSDHLILDVDDMTVPPSIGETVRFALRYSAMLDLATSPYVPLDIL